MDSFTTDKALFAACRSDFPAIRVKLNREWNEFTINAPGHAVEHVDKAHCPAEQATARGEVYQAAQRLAGDMLGAIVAEHDSLVGAVA